MAGSHLSHGSQGEQRGIMPITTSTAGTGHHRKKHRKTASTHPSYGSEVEQQGIMSITTTAATGDNRKAQHARSTKQQKLTEPHRSSVSEEQQQGILSITTTTTAIGDHWEVQYARFFICPSLSSSASAGARHPSLVPRVKRPKGLWISSFTSLANLKLLTTNHSDTSRSFILTVTLIDNVVEEHYISKLNFTWPQVSCLSGFPPRGSKVVFMSYRDQVGQIQKFVVRFLTIDETERFINLLKEIFGLERINGSMFGISKSKTSSESEIIPSFQAENRQTQEQELITSSVDFSEPMYRPILDWSPKASFSDTSIQLLHPSDYQDGSENSNSLEATFSQNVQGKLAAFPPSFTSLLMNCYPTEQATQLPVPEEVNLKNDKLDFIPRKYLEDPSFQEMLSKVQKVVSEFEDDLML